MKKHRGKLYNYLYSIVKSKEIAEEIVLDVFMKMWTGRELIMHIENMDAFLHKVACNKALDFLRIASRNEALQKLARREMELAKEKEADHKMLEQECREIIDQAIQQLSPQRRMVFTLSRMHGLSYDEIAQKLQLSRNTVRNTMAETLRSLRTFLHKNNISSLLLVMLLVQS
ncbi:MAG: RNA polymerase sigma-70 factor [Agriterribacter sp.]